MTAVATCALPARRPDLVIRALGEDGRYVVKDPKTGEFFQIGEAEQFLLEQLDGTRDADAIRAAFEEKFGEPLPEDDLYGFLESVREQGLLQSAGDGAGADLPRTAPRSILYWRVNLWDPDRLFTRLAPKLWFFWTRTFLVASAASILFAVVLVWANRHELSGSFRGALRWETVAVGWIALFVVTLLHECAHGLTCKHHGGEVHEIGFLCMYFLPCFYCNVSDAWLFKEKSKRLWVTCAGGYFELFLWALAVFAWRLTAPGTQANYVAFVVLTVCGVQVLFNFNPLLKLDGYYLLSDWREVPNLHQRGQDHFKGHLRRLLWGAPRPEPEARGRFLLSYGSVSWLVSAAFLSVSLAGLAQLAGPRLGWAGYAAAVVVGVVSVRALFRGFTSGEVRSMLLSRHKRTAAWLLALGAVASGLFLVEIEDWVSAPFQVRSAVRTEIRAPAAGFVREVRFDEGDRVSPGAVVVRLEVPDLPARLAQNRAEVREAEARLRLIEEGARPEERAQQRDRVERARAWRDRADQNLARAKEVLKEDLARLEHQVAQYRGELVAAEAARDRVVKGAGFGVASETEAVECQRRVRVTQAQLDQSIAERRVREVRGTAEAEEELARREKELADCRAALALLGAGSRPDEIAAQHARVAGFKEEVRRLEDLQGSLTIACPVGGIVTTPRLREKIGQYVREGDPICVVEEPERLDVEAVFAEEKAARVAPGQSVSLKPRAVALETYPAVVDRVAPVAGRGDAQGSLTIYCRMEARIDLRPGMTGHAKVYTGRRSVGGIILDQTRRTLRAEFWW